MSKLRTRLNRIKEQEKARQYNIQKRMENILEQKRSESEGGIVKDIDNKLGNRETKEKS